MQPCRGGDSGVGSFDGRGAVIARAGRDQQNHCDRQDKSLLHARGFCTSGHSHNWSKVRLRSRVAPVEQTRQSVAASLSYSPTLAV
jgi:hypothetical protein